MNIVRLMIDQHHQGGGLGRQLLNQAIADIRILEPPVDVIRISTLPENQIASKLYTSAGFIETGKEEGEIALYLEMDDIDHYYAKVMDN